MDQFIAATLIWLAGQMGLPPHIEPPTVVYMSQGELRNLSSHSHQLGDRYSVGGMYNARDNLIYLPQGFDMENPFSQSVLVHELVHYLQDSRNLRFECAGAIEEQAYRLQGVWLQNQGLTPPTIPHFVLAEIRECNPHAFVGSVQATDRPPNGERLRRRQQETTATSGVRVFRGGSTR